MEDSWHLASESYHIGRRQAAEKHLENALAATSPTSTLQRAILQINKHAVSTCSKTAPPPPIPTTSSNEAVIRLLAEEAYLTAAYNATLRALRDNTNASLAPLKHALKRVPSVLEYLTDVTIVDPTFQPLDLPPDAVRLAIERLVPEADFTNPDLRGHVRRWADAAATCYELLTAGSRIQKRPIANVIAVAKSLRNLINTLSTPQSFEATQQYDSHAARCDYLQTLSEGTISARAQAPNEELHLPLAYLTAVKHVLTGDPSARRLLEVCASRSYRLADSLSLLARLERGHDALRAWQTVFAIDVRRPAALWLAAREFGRLGKYPQQAQILGCLEQLLDAGPAEHTGVKIEEFDIMADDMEDIAVENTVTKHAVIAERARALAGAEEWGEVEKLMDGLKDDVLARADVLRDRALCAVCNGDVTGGISLAEVAKAAAAGPTDSAGALLIQAEGLLRMEKVHEARTKVMEAFREAKLGLVGMSWEAEAPRLLRGICFHNLAVLHHCVNENVAADECFAAAETAFKKCEEECKEVASRLAVLSAFGRCLAMWARGLKEDAAEYWRVVRGLDLDCMEEEEDVEDGAEDIRPECHVSCDVPDEILERFNRLCLKLCREVERRKEMERMVEEVEKEWPLGQKRRQTS